MRTVIPVENNDLLAAMRAFLKRLLEEEVVDGVLVPMATPFGAVAPALVTDAGLLDAADPLVPVLGLNSARAIGPVSVREPRGRFAVVLRSCELRALVELVKLQQASLGDLLTVSVDCLGTYSVPDYERIRADGKFDRSSLLAGAQSGDLAPHEGYAFRDACQMCVKPLAEGADVTFELFGTDTAAGLPVTMPDDLADKLGWSAVEAPGRREDIVDKVVSTRLQAREQLLGAIQERLAQEGIEEVLGACVRCHNCMTVCPICYCKTCLFKSPIFDHDPVQYLNWARRKGAQRLPSDTMLFHLTRLNHMVLSCIGCGVCSDGCPAELPVSRVFQAIAQDLQTVFEYVPGQTVDEPLPMITFREDEWSEVGEE